MAAREPTDVGAWQPEDVWTTHIRWRLTHGSFTESEWRRALMVACDALDRATAALRLQEMAVVKALNAHAFPGVVYHEYDRVSCA